MIGKIECTIIECDCCGEIFQDSNDFSIFPDNTSALERLSDGCLWHREGDKQYCPACFTENEDETITIKESCTFRRCGTSPFIRDWEKRAKSFEEKLDIANKEVIFLQEKVTAIVKELTILSDNYMTVSGEYCIPKTSLDSFIESLENGENIICIEPIQSETAEQYVIEKGKNFKNANSNYEFNSISSLRTFLEDYKNSQPVRLVKSNKPSQSAGNVPSKELFEKDNKLNDAENFFKKYTEK